MVGRLFNSFRSQQGRSTTTEKGSAAKAAAKTKPSGSTVAATKLPVNGAAHEAVVRQRRKLTRASCVQRTSLGKLATRKSALKSAENEKLADRFQGTKKIVALTQELEEGPPSPGPGKLPKPPTPAQVRNARVLLRLKDYDWVANLPALSFAKSVMNQRDLVFEEAINSRHEETKKTLQQRTVDFKLELSEVVSKDTYFTKNYGEKLIPLTIPADKLDASARLGAQRLGSGAALDLKNMGQYLNFAGRGETPEISDPSVRQLLDALTFPAIHADELNKAFQDPKVLKAWNKKREDERSFSEALGDHDLAKDWKQRMGGFTISETVGFVAQFNAEQTKIPEKLNSAMSPADDDKQKSLEARAKMLVGVSGEWAVSMTARIHRLKILTRILNDPEFLMDCPDASRDLLSKLGKSFLDFLDLTMDPDGAIQQSLALALQAAKSPERFLSNLGGGEAGDGFTPRIIDNEAPH